MIMDCKACGVTSKIFILRADGDLPPQEEDPTLMYYCPVCSSAEPAREETDADRP